MRGRFRRSPATLHRALRELNAGQPVPTPAPMPPEQSFYAAADAAFDGATLRYSRRLELLAVADRLAIPPRRANLIIAEVRHRRTSAEAPATRAWVVSICVGVLLQACIVVSAALLLRH